eukprot:Nitzschia sp. Nitz4//scaffold174_size87051//46375//47718//NITZ4_005111-RA/size87051-processed-gene-0.24-mRNA-1//1//CDS//3329538878//4431//frame0
MVSSKGKWTRLIFVPPFALCILSLYLSETVMPSHNEDFLGGNHVIRPQDIRHHFLHPSASNRNKDSFYPIQFETQRNASATVSPGYSERDKCTSEFRDSVIRGMVKQGIRFVRKKAANPQRLDNQEDGAAALCLFVKNENFYLREWVNFHLSLGFDDIYILDDGRNVQFQGGVSSTHVHVIPVSKEISERNNKQTLALDACVKIIKGRQPEYKTSIVSHLDVDEFLVLRNHHSVKDFMKDHCPPDLCGSVAINWVWFGTGNQTRYSDEPVVSRFRYRDIKPTPVVKTVFRLESFFCATNPHFVHLSSNPSSTNHVPPFAYDTAGRITVLGHASDQTLEHAAVVHHYSKSIEEWYYRRCIRGAAVHPLRKCTGLYPASGQVYDTSAVQIYERIPMEARTTRLSTHPNQTVPAPYVGAFEAPPWDPVDPSRIEIREIVPIMVAASTTLK